MKLEEMKRIADTRSKGLFHEWYYRNFAEVPIEQQQKNMIFLAMAANNIDKLIAVAEAALKFKEGVFHLDYSDYYGLNELMEALQALEQGEE